MENEGVGRGAKHKPVFTELNKEHGNVEQKELNGEMFS